MLAQQKESTGFGTCLLTCFERVAMGPGYGCQLGPDPPVPLVAFES